MGQRHIIFMPGSGEGPSAQGLASDMEERFSPPPFEYHFHRLDFCLNENGDRIIPDLQVHIDTIQRTIDSIPTDDEVILAAKSGGHRAAAFIGDRYLSRLNKFVSFVPPSDGGEEILYREMPGWGLTEQKDGSWAGPRKSGEGQFIVTPEYIKSVGKKDVIARYRKVARLTEMVIIRALDDEMFDPIDLSQIPGVKNIDINRAGHHFLVAGCRDEIFDTFERDGILEISSEDPLILQR